MVINDQIGYEFDENLAFQNLKYFESHSEKFVIVFNNALKVLLSENATYRTQKYAISFLDNCFNSLDLDFVRNEVSKIYSIQIWINLLPAQRIFLLEQNSKLKKFWNKAEKKFNKLQKAEADELDFNRRFLWNLLQKFKKTIDYIDNDLNTFDPEIIEYCERFLSLLIDLEAQLTTRRFVNSLILASHVIVHCHLSNFITTEYGSLFCELLTMLKFYARFEIDDLTGMQLTSAEMTKKHYDYVTNLQKAAFKYFKNSLIEFSLLNVGSVDTRKFLTNQFYNMPPNDLYKIAEYLKLVPESDNQIDLNNNYCRFNDVAYLSEMIIFFCERRLSQLQKLNSQPLYPSEKVIWDEKLIPYDEYDEKSVLPLNKLNLQFLTFHDYLLRNFNLFQMESTYEIRQDLENILYRMNPCKHETNENEIVWCGWARMALPISKSSCRIVTVAKPLVGEFAPAEVKADITITLTQRMDIRNEWESLRKNDVLFLLKVSSNQKIGAKFDAQKSFKSLFDIVVVRGCEVEGFLGPDGRVIDEIESKDVLKKMPDNTRTLRVRFDPNQYKLDTDEGVNTDLYYTFNLLVRRDPKTNNFKAVLGTIRQLLNTECVVPDWLHDIILGYGEPDSAHYTKLANDSVATSNFNDTFLSFDHLKASFPNKKIICNDKNPIPPFRLTFKELVAQHNVEDASIRDFSIIVESQQDYQNHLNFCGEIEGFEKIRRNVIEFTPSQIEAIKSGMQPGLTIVVGPPGTGKTDVAVQIISNIYHNWPEQRTLIVTHSNQTLNQLFEKIIALDVDERHLLRMGHGEEALETEKDFSRYGRVNYVLKERNALLERVAKLSEILNEVGDVSYSCETAGYFYRYTVVKTWEHFLTLYNQLNLNIKEDGDSIENDWVLKNFPFLNFFSSDLFKGKNIHEDYSIAQICWRQIQSIFKKLDEFFPFELLRNGRDRANYLLIKEAKIIAMTCTHAALRRKDLVDLSFRYDNILMEESAQILEVETFIPLLLQDPHDGRNRLKRWIMIGDHHQLPPIVQNIAYQKYANMEQSLFTRFIRLGVPFIELDAQGRARAEIADLFNWNYNKLGNLPHITTDINFQVSNSGFLYNLQFVNVPDFNGAGESTPSPYFYQNLGEAEYACALFIYMRIIGYPAQSISIITTYNGQVSLIKDVINKRCANNPLIGMPGKISTVDKYQGQQNDYVILSLVRTKLIGHLRDVRRLVVALSRARLGLYVLGRVNLFKDCLKLKPAFDRLLKYPTELMLIPNENFLIPIDQKRKNNEPPTIEPLKIINTEHISHFVKEFYASNLETLKQRYIDSNCAEILTPNNQELN